MRTIIVPVNFSPNSTNAAHYAADMARAIGAELSLVNVFQPTMTISEMPMPEYAFEEIRDNNLNLLQTLALDLLKRTGNRIKVTVDLEIGDVETKLESFCRNKKTFIVVMGASGKSIENTLQESNTIRAVRHLPYPVLVIPENAAFHGVKNIVVACDREDIDSGIPTVLSTLRDLGQLLGAQLKIVHVLTDGKESATEAIEEYNVWKKAVKLLAPELHFVRQHKVEDGVSEYLQGNEADWLMVFPKSHSLLEFHRSRSRQIVLSCCLPVMSIHE